MKHVTMEDIVSASHVLQGVIEKTPLQYSARLSERYGCNVYLKREDLQNVRSFKIRGAYHFIRTLSAEQLAKGVVCASAGNHAQGVAFSCHAMGIHGKIFMPSTTPRQKVSQVKRFGGEYVEVILTGDTFDDSYLTAVDVCQKEGMTFVHPFDDHRIIAGQGTVGLEIIEEMEVPVDMLFMSVGGGGLASGVGAYLRGASPQTRLIGVEPSGAASMKESFANQEVVMLDQIDKFVDGAAVKQVGKLTYEMCQGLLDDIITVPEGKVCTTILELYNEMAIVAEPAGALSIAALDLCRDEIKGKNIVCVVSGGNNDIDRMQEIKERSLAYEGLKHYFLITFPQRAGALREFINNVLGENDDITRFEYTKKNNRENGPALVGIELKHQDDYQTLINRMNLHNIHYTELNREPDLFQLLI
ncbi:threonine ammonia-lyase IlvA [Brevibacillus dissolubilis]|uniref:threonine ammonia-lyase IlvA n=1 Tax=Brevibacillus dissolubilis TaxID=1844116 RepID=UPI00111766C9|nr:threonine ammonia-lyase IlvA [Brevibacillus dissolubilis]